MEDNLKKQSKKLEDALSKKGKWKTTSKKWRHPKKINITEDNLKKIKSEDDPNIFGKSKTTLI
jgi:hypothetical protein